LQEGFPLLAVSHISFILNIYVQLKSFHTLEFNQRVFVYEDDTWAAKGRYENALEDNDHALWSFDNGQDTLHMLIVSQLYYFHFQI
jgi:hypothetical protein